MAVTAHNVANVNTAGFEPQRALYATGPQGRGVRLDAVSQRSPQVGRVDSPAAQGLSDAALTESAGIRPVARSRAAERHGCGTGNDADDLHATKL